MNETKEKWKFMCVIEPASGKCKKLVSCALDLASSRKRGKKIF